MIADGDADDVGGFGQPLPPDDRLWRHPSELAALGDEALAPAGDRPRPSPLGASWTAIAAAGLVGAVLATGVLVVTGSMGSQVVERTVVERVAMSPVVSSPMLRGDLGVVAVSEQVGPSVARVEVTTADGVRRGSAVAFRSDGHLLTSAALVEGSTAVVAVVGGRRLVAAVVGADPLTDVAVLAVDASDLPVAVLASDDGLLVGQPTVTLSAARSGASPVVATSVVSALGRRLDRVGTEALYGLVQLDSSPPEGSLGAPVLDSRGSVIGVATEDDTAGRFGFAVPIGVVQRVVDDLLDSGFAKHCWLGISAVDLDVDRAALLGVAGGTVVREVSPSSPALDAGLAGGDVITELDGQPVDGVSHLVAELRQRRPGDRLVIGYWRDDTHAEVDVTLAERP